MPNQINIETARTYLRNLSCDDAESFYKINLDKEVIKYTGDAPFQTIADAKIFLDNYDQYQKYGVGRLAVIDKKSRKFIGWCGLKFDPELNEYDIGFRFFREYWGQGYATETAKKCLQFGFDNLNINEIVGRAMAENTASIKVLEKIGMSFKKNFNFEGQEGVIYTITRIDYKNDDRTAL